MTMKRTLSVWLQSAYLNFVTPPNEYAKTGLNGMSSPFFDLIFGVIKTIHPPSIPEKESEIKVVQIPAGVEKLLTETKKSFRQNSDMLVISESDLEEAKQYDEEGWLNSISTRTIVMNDSLKNYAVVSGGYSSW